jgi:hypothetical protein
MPITKVSFSCSGHLYIVDNPSSSSHNWRCLSLCRRRLPLQHLLASGAHTWQASLASHWDILESHIRKGRIYGSSFFL